MPRFSFAGILTRAVASERKGLGDAPSHCCCFEKFPDILTDNFQVLLVETKNEQCHSIKHIKTIFVKVDFFTLLKIKLRYIALNYIAKHLTIPFIRIYDQICLAS